MKIVKAHWTCALTGKERLYILMLKVHLCKEHAQRCRKMGPSRKAIESIFLSTVECIFDRKRDLVQ